MPRGLGSAPVYPMLIDHSNISNGFDLFTKQSSVADITIKLSNTPFYPSTGTAPLRVAALLEDLNGSACKIYQWVEGITDITDCLCIFDGYIYQSLEVRGAVATFTAKDRSKQWDVRVPFRKMVEEWAAAPEETANYFIPLVYGEFDESDEYLTNDDATGLVRTLLNSYTSGNMTIADQALHSVIKGYREVGGPSVLPTTTLNSDNDDAGVAWIRPSLSMTMDFYPDPTLPGIYNDESYVEPLTERTELADQDSFLVTRCSFKDRYSDNGTTLVGRALWGIQSSAILRDHMLNSGYIKGMYQSIKADGSFAQNLIAYIRFYLYYGITGATDQRVECGRADINGSAGASVLVWNSATYHIPGDETYEPDATDVNTETPGNVWAMSIDWQTINNIPPRGDHVLGNQTLGSMANAKLRYYHTTTQQSFAWATATGKNYGTLAGQDFSGPTDRNNDYHTDQPITDPTFIIEDLYRTYVGLTDDDIDVASFDASANYDVEARINITDQTLVSEIVEQLLEQSTVILHASGAGGLRCIPLYDITPTTVATITRDQLVGDVIGMEKTRYIVNALTVNSRWQAEYGRFKDSDFYEDALSRAKLKDRTATFSWENICGASAVYVAEHYVNSVDGLWSKEHIMTTFTTPGLMYSHLQPGDWIELNTDIDDLCPAFTSSWAGKQLLITQTEHSLVGTSFIAIELF